MGSGAITILAAAHDFVASPAISPDGGRLAWVSWDHPDMPWDETSLWLADIDPEGQLCNTRQISGGRFGAQKISVQQPRFSPAGILYFISDQSGWWNLYRWEDETATIAHELAAEFGLPHWVFGTCTYQFLSEDQLLCIYGVGNEYTLARLNPGDNTLEDFDLPYSEIDHLSHDGQSVVFIAASPTLFQSIVRYDLLSGAIDIIKRSSALTVDTAYLSEPETIEFATGDEETAHGFFYPPANPDHAAPADEKPPLLVMIHGGPTSATHNGLRLRTQFWTSRGFAVLDVNHRGSTGYGRDYRDKLLGQWGVVDIEDTVSACNYLAAQGRVDPDRLAIRGGSAGGYTTLSALTFTDSFKVGASYYGVSDLEALAKETHKFESRYLDGMIGPYTERTDIYHDRSPIHHTDQLSSACIFFQGRPLIRRGASYSD